MTEQKPASAKKVAAAGVGAVGLFGAAVIAAATPQVQKFEGRRLYPYYDAVKVLTVCDGETHGIKMRPYTDAECDGMTGKAMAATADAIRPCLPPTLPATAQIAVLVTAYNIGSGAFCGSTIAARIRAGNLRGGCDAMLMWDKGRVGGKLVVLRGLALRRAAERQMCLTGLA